MREAAAEQIRALDAAAIAALERRAARAEFSPPVPGEAAAANPLMRAAALALADRVCAIASRMAVRPAAVAVCGGGDNGRDAAIALSFLARRGFETIRIDAAAAAFAPPPFCAIPSPAVVLDGLLGIGIKGAPRPGAAAAIDWMNSLRASRAPGAVRIVAVDLPSGLDADCRAMPAAATAVCADETLSMGLPKRVFFAPGAVARTGEIRIVPLYEESETAPFRDALAGEGEVCLFEECGLALARPRRAWNANKFSFGKVAVFAGSRRYPGAAMMATLGALRGGAGLVSAFAPEALVPAFAARAPEAMWAGFGGETVCARALARCAPALDGAVVAMGPGFSRAPGVAEAVDWLFSSAGAQAFVVDADALFALGELPGAPCGAAACESRRAALSRAVLTPHAGEAARLLGVAASAVEADRVSAVRELVRRSGATVLLKGAGTLVAAPGRPVRLVAAGSPALAKGGSGDILCGIVAALAARGLDLFDAASAAALLHGRAASAATLGRSAESFLPSDLLDCLDGPV